MASVVSTQLVSDRAEPGGWRFVRYRFDLLDNRNENHVEYVGPKYVEPGFDTDADMLAISPAILLSKADQELSEFESAMEQGQDPLHVDMGGFFEKVLPRWQTWDDAFRNASEYFWGLTNLIAILPFSLTWGRVSNTGKRNALDTTNQIVSDMNGDMQIADNTKITLDGYNPHYDEDSGVFS